MEVYNKENMILGRFFHSTFRKRFPLLLTSFNSINQDGAWLQMLNGSQAIINFKNTQKLFFK